MALESVVFKCIPMDSEEVNNTLKIFRIMKLEY